MKSLNLLIGVHLKWWQREKSGSQDCLDSYKSSWAKSEIKISDVQLTCVHLQDL